jgi:AmmeMemoRadiSam system protein B
MNADGYTGYEVAFDKVVLVGVDPAASGPGVYVAECGEMTDPTATKWLRDKAASFPSGANILDSASTAGVDNQAPFIDIVMAEKRHANVVTLIMGQQSNQLGQQVGDLLFSLVNGDGIWVNKKVLFVIAADLSKNLDKEWARDRDGTTLEEVTGGSFNTMITYNKQLQEASEGDQSRGPVDFAAVLSSMKLAQNLALNGKVVMFGNSGDYIGDPTKNQNDLVQGYGAVVFSKSTLTASQEASAACPDPELPDETTTTTGAPTTPEVPTMSPAPFGTTQDGGMVVLMAAPGPTAAPAEVQTAAHYQHRLGQPRRSGQTLAAKEKKAAPLLRAK